MPLFKKSVDDEGNEIYEEVSPDEIPEDEIKETKLFQKVLEETIGRRKTIAELSQKLEQLAADESDESQPTQSKQETPKQSKQTPTTPTKEEAPSINPDELYETFRERFMKELKEQQEQEQSKAASVDSILKENRVPEDLAYLVRDLYDARGEEVAKKAAADIAKQRAMFGAGAGGDISNRVDAIRAGAFKQLGLED